MADSILSELPRKLQIFPQSALFYWDFRKLFPVPKTSTLRKEEIFFFLVSPQTDALIALTYSDLLETIFDKKNLNSFFSSKSIFFSPCPPKSIFFIDLYWFQYCFSWCSCIIYSSSLTEEIQLYFYIRSVFKMIQYGILFHILLYVSYISDISGVKKKLTWELGIYMCLSHSFPHNYILLIILQCIFQWYHIINDTISLT